MAKPEDVGLLRVLGGTVGEWLSEAFSDTDQREKTQGVERMYAFVDVMMLAVLADGEMLPEELDVLDSRLQQASELEISLSEAKARIEYKAKQIDSPQKMRAALNAAAFRLPEAKDRALAYQLAAALRNAGARLGVKRGGYRQNVATSDDGSLLNLFAEVLEVPDGDRPALEKAQLPEGFIV